MTADALAHAAHHLASSRKSATRIANDHTARAIARGRCTWLVADIEASLLDDLGVRRDTPGVQIDWRAYAGQPGELARRDWSPGTPLPEHTAFVSCTVSAPLAPSHNPPQTLQRSPS
jgi:hypothetical protein